jgi:hypothetical protein
LAFTASIAAVAVIALTGLFAMLASSFLAALAMAVVQAVNDLSTAVTGFKADIVEPSVAGTALSSEATSVKFNTWGDGRWSHSSNTVKTFVPTSDTDKKPSNEESNRTAEPVPNNDGTIAAEKGETPAADASTTADEKPEATAATTSDGEAALEAQIRIARLRLKDARREMLEIRSLATVGAVLEKGPRDAYATIRNVPLRSPPEHCRGPAFAIAPGDNWRERALGVELERVECRLEVTREEIFELRTLAETGMQLVTHGAEDYQALQRICKVQKHVE